MKTHCLTATSATLCVLLLSASCHAMDYGEGHANLAPIALLDNNQGQHGHWKAIGRLQPYKQHKTSYCSAALIDTRGALSDTSGPAYVLTSGHCIAYSALNVKTNLPSNGHIDFNAFHDTTTHTQRYNLKKVNWSSMRGTDIAIVELDANLQTLIDNGITPLQLASAQPQTNDPLLVVGIPSGYEQEALRLSVCSHVSTEQLLEQPGLLRHAEKNHCKGLKPGSSGSPVLERHSNKLVAVLATSTVDSLEENRCFENTPCEIKNGQPLWAPDSNYSSPVVFLNQCFANGRFEPTTEGCDLLPTVTLSMKNPQAYRYYHRVHHDDLGQPVLAGWNLAFALDTPVYRYKTVRDAQLCENPDNYSPAIEIDGAYINDLIGPEPGIYLLCVIGIDSAAQQPTWPMMKHPLVFATEIAQPGPTRAPQLDIRRKDDGGYRVVLHYSNPVLSAYRYKTGTPETTDCNNAHGYEQAMDDLEFPATALPLKLCTQARDMSGQWSAPRTDLLTTG